MFTFVNVELNETNLHHKSRSRAISAEDNQRIRSQAAANPWNRARAAQQGPYGRKSKTKVKEPKRAATKISIFPVIHEDSNHSTENTAIETESIANLQAYFSSLESFPSLSSFSRLSSETSVFDWEDSTDEDIADGQAAAVIKPNTSKSTVRDRFLETHQRTEAMLGRLAAWEFLQKMPNYVKTGRIDPFWTFPIPYTPVLSTSLNYTITYLAPETLVFAKQPGNWLAFWLLGKDDPAFLFPIILFSLAILRSTGIDKLLGQPVDEKHLAWLKGSTFHAIRMAILRRDRSTAETSVLVSGLLTMICYEETFGDKGLRDMHADAVRELLEPIGGWDALHPLIRNMVEWQLLHQLKSDLTRQDQPSKLLRVLPKTIESSGYCVFTKCQDGKVNLRTREMPDIVQKGSGFFGGVDHDLDPTEV